ncbi:MAG: acyl-CoA dehydrogenase family protein, partial [Bacteroidaceae bacterium]|nr:acyl-CoA dehydrogenase family protein [Bacteroidaceae bacterium]
MNFNLTKTQELFRQMIREFAEKEVKPLAAEIDEQDLVLILSVRLMGKRQIGQMEASEFVVTMLVANLASIP